MSVPTMKLGYEGRGSSKQVKGYSKDRLSSSEASMNAEDAAFRSGSCASFRLAMMQARISGLSPIRSTCNQSRRCRPLPGSLMDWGVDQRRGSPASVGLSV